MRSNITTRIAVAIAAAVVAELTDKVLDSIGLSREGARLSREIIKAVAAAIAAVLVDSILNGLRETGIDMPLSAKLWPLYVNLYPAAVAYKVVLRVSGLTWCPLRPDSASKSVTRPGRCR
jgi:hypothetical protein